MMDKQENEQIKAVIVTECAVISVLIRVSRIKDKKINYELEFNFPRKEPTPHTVHTYIIVVKGNSYLATYRSWNWG